MSYFRSCRIYDKIRSFDSGLFLHVLWSNIFYLKSINGFLLISFVSAFSVGCKVRYTKAPKKVSIILREKNSNQLLSDKAVEFWKENSRKEVFRTDPNGYVQIDLKKEIPEFKRKLVLEQYKLRLNKNTNGSRDVGPDYYDVPLSNFMDIYNLYQENPEVNVLESEKTADIHFHISLKPQNRFGYDFFNQDDSRQNLQIPDNLIWYDSHKKLKVFYKGKWRKPYLGPIPDGPLTGKWQRRAQKRDLLLNRGYLKPGGGNNNTLVQYSQSTMPNVEAGKVFIGFNSISPFEHNLANTRSKRIVSSLFKTKARSEWLRMIGDKQLNFSHWQNFKTEHELMRSQSENAHNYTWTNLKREDEKIDQNTPLKVVNVVEGGHILQDKYIPHDLTYNIEKRPDVENEYIYYNIGKYGDLSLAFGLIKEKLLSEKAINDVEEVNKEIILEFLDAQFEGGSWRQISETDEYSVRLFFQTLELKSLNNTASKQRIENYVNKIMMAHMEIEDRFGPDDANSMSEDDLRQLYKDMNKNWESWLIGEHQRFEYTESTGAPLLDNSDGKRIYKKGQLRKHKKSMQAFDFSNSTSRDDELKQRIDSELNDKSRNDLRKFAKEDLKVNSKQRAYIKDRYNLFKHFAVDQMIENEIRTNVRDLKALNRPQIHMMTIAHLSYNGLIGHSPAIDDGGWPARVLTRKVNAIKVSDDPSYQSQWMSIFYTIPGLTKFGNIAIESLLDNTNGSPRIFIDTKHCDFMTRHALYKRYEQDSDDLIPPICSHCAVTGLKSDYYSPFNDDYDLKSAPFTTTFYPFGLNLYDEEIEKICHLGGIIGIPVEQRVLGGYINKKETRTYSITRKNYNYEPNTSSKMKRFKYDKFWLRHLKKDMDNNQSALLRASYDYTVQLLGPNADEKEVMKTLEEEYRSIEPFLQNLFYIIDHSGKLTASTKNDPWGHVCIGGDHDGAIDVLEYSPTTAQYPHLKKRIKQFTPIFLEIRNKNKPESNSYNDYFDQRFTIDDALDKLFYESLRDFTNRVFLQ